MAKTATVGIEFDVEYPNTCKSCQDSGKSGVKIGFSGAEGGIICATGLHRFDSLPEDGSTPSKPPAASLESKAPQDNGVKLNMSPLAAKFSGVETVDQTTKEQLAHRVHEALQEQKREEARKGTRTVPPQVKEPELPAPVTDLPLPGKVEIRGLRSVGGGELEVILVLREDHASAIKAEAEVQRETPQQYLQRWITEALENFWSR